MHFCEPVRVCKLLLFWACILQRPPPGGFLSDDSIRKPLFDDSFLAALPPMALSGSDFYPKAVSFPGNEELRASGHFSYVHFFESSRHLQIINEDLLLEHLLQQLRAL